MFSQFWQRYRSSPLLAELGARAAYFIKAAGAIYIVRENLIEFTVVSVGVPRALSAAMGGGRRLAAGRLPRRTACIAHPPPVLHLHPALPCSAWAPA